MRKRVLLAHCLLLLSVVACNSFDGPVANEEPLETPDLEKIRALMRTVAEHQVEQTRSIDEQGPSWRYCAFYIGALAAHRATDEEYYSELADAWARANDWQISRRPRHADYQCIGQVFLDLYRHDPAPHKLRSTKQVFDEIIEDSSSEAPEWDWADALFMAPPVLARLGATTGEAQYFDFLARQFWEASAPLYDPEYGLYYRDERYVDQRTASGRKVFWARGNGWVLAGLVRILQFLPSHHSSYQQFVERYRRVAASVASLQQEDGFWRTSLLDPSEFPSPESSSTALFCYALGWGIHAEHLPAEPYRSVVLKAWAGLETAVDDHGQLGWVQDVGSRPGPVSVEDTGIYGTGALLLAGSELMRLLEPEGLGRVD